MNGLKQHCLFRKESDTPLYYLAGPYSHKDQAIMDQREIDHAKCAVELKLQGYSIYAPIPETTALTKLGGLVGTSWKDWRDHDLNLLSRCDEIIIILIEGWRESIGVRGEVKFAIQNDIPISYLDPNLYILIGVSNEQVLDELGVDRVENLND